MPFISNVAGFGKVTAKSAPSWLRGARGAGFEPSPSSFNATKSFRAASRRPPPAGSAPAQRGITLAKEVWVVSAYSRCCCRLGGGRRYAGRQPDCAACSPSYQCVRLVIKGCPISECFAHTYCPPRCTPAAAEGARQVGNRPRRSARPRSALPTLAFTGGRGGHAVWRPALPSRPPLGRSLPGAWPAGTGGTVQRRDRQERL